MTSITALSIISIIVIESVSDAKASVSAVPNSNCALRSGINVREIAESKGENTESMTVDQFPHPSAVPVIIPSTSPIETASETMNGCTECETIQRRSLS